MNLKISIDVNQILNFSKTNQNISVSFMGLTYDLGGITLHPHHHEPKFKSHPVIFPLRNKNKNMTLVSLKI